jgi:hypothetical protein
MLGACSLRYEDALLLVVELLEPTNAQLASGEIVGVTRRGHLIVVSGESYQSVTRGGRRARCEPALEGVRWPDYRTPAAARVAIAKARERKEARDALGARVEELTAQLEHVDEALAKARAVAEEVYADVARSQP